MVISDHWSNMTMLDILEAVLIVLRDVIQFNRLLSKKGREQWAIWQEYCPSTGCLQMMTQNLVFILDFMLG